MKQLAKNLKVRRKEKRKHLIDHEEYVDKLKDALFALDKNWRFTFFNNEAERLLMRKREEVLGKIVWDEFPEAFRTTFYYEYNIAMKERKTVQFQEFFSPLSTWFDVRAYPTKQGLLVHFRDVTKEKREIDINKQHYESLFDWNPDAVYSFDLDGNYLSANASFEKMSGYSKEEVLKMKYALVVAPEDIEKTADHFQKATKGEVQNYNITAITKQGERLLVNVTNIPITVHNEIVGVYGIAKDITKSFQEQEALLKSEEMHTLISENSQDIITISSPEGICTYISPAVFHILGYDAKEVQFTPLTKYYHPDDVPHITNNAQDTNVSRGRIQHKNGEYIWFEISSKIIRDNHGNIEKILGVARNISERIQSEMLMRKSEKLSLAGQLAAGVAHEIRNPLTAIKGFLQIMLSGQHLKREYLDVMYSELTRIEDIIHELLLLAKPNQVNFSEKNIHTILDHVVTLIETEANKESISIETSFSSDNLLVNCEENQLKQVFINLIKNAIDAMPKGGEIIITTERNGEEVNISFKDNGYGIPKEILEKIGQPFYTTKEKGTGLGLAVSFNIVDTHNGRVHVDSNIGEGTTFTLSFPLVSMEYAGNAELTYV